MNDEALIADFGNQHGLNDVITKALQHLRPPPDLKPSEWAERNVYIPVGNAIPGLIRFDNAPYQREPLDMTENPECQRITLMWSAQVGKTMLALCAQAYKIAQNPQSQIMMQPSQGDLSTWLETKFNPLVEANETLQELIAKPRGREGVNNQRMKSYPGGFIMFSWSGSPKTMRGRSAPLIVADEVDGYDKTQEGHPVSLLWQRAATFGDQRKLLEISTPTIKHASFIEDAFDAGDQRRFHVECLHCKHKQPLWWRNVTWTNDDPSTAVYACEECGTAWTDAERYAAIRQGEWLAEREFKGHASYHLNELYSCFRKLSDVVQSFLEKKRNHDLQTFVNVSLAETWEEDGDGVDDHMLADRCEDWGEHVPDQVIALFAGVDVQDDRLEVEILGIGKDEETWSVDYHVLYGDPSSNVLWDDLDGVLLGGYTKSDGSEMHLRATCIDSGGHHTQRVYQYCKMREAHRIYAIKGIAGSGRPLVGKPTKSNIGKVKLFPVGVDTAKQLVMSRLKIDEPGPGYCHFPQRSDEYFKQLTAEKLVTRYQRGHAQRVWVNTRKRNEALDCRVYAWAAYGILAVNINRLSPKTRSEKQKPERSQRVRPNRQNFVKGW